MSNTPTIQEQIEAEARKRWYYDNADEILKRGFFVEGAAFASTLYEKEITYWKDRYMAAFNLLSNEDRDRIHQYVK